MKKQFSINHASHLSIFLHKFYEIYYDATFVLMLHLVF